MPQVTIGDTVYELDALSEEAQVQLNGQQVVDPRIDSIHSELAILRASPHLHGADRRMAYLQEDLSILETARRAYDRALKEALAGEG